MTCFFLLLLFFAFRVFTAQLFALFLSFVLVCFFFSVLCSSDS